MNSTTDAAVKLFKILAKHADIIVKAYEAENCYFSNNEDSEKAINDLLKFDFVIQDENSVRYRLNSTIRSLLDHGLKTSRLRMINTDVAQSIDGIRVLIKAYNESKYANRVFDMISLLSSLDSNVSDLCDSLTSQSRNIWRQIDNDFNTVTSLSVKMQLNNNALDKIKLLLQSLDHIDFEELMGSSNRDAELRKIINVKLSKSIDTVRRDLNVSLQRLTKALFKLKQLQDRAKLVNNWSEHFNRNPGYQIPDFTNTLDVYYLFKGTRPLPITGVVDVKNPSHEEALAEIIKDIRKTPPKDENQPVVHASADDQDQEEETLVISPFLLAVRELYYKCLVENIEVSAIDSYIEYAPEGTEVHLWISGIVAEYNAMPESSKSNFTLNYKGQFDSVFDGNFLASDITICPV